MHVELVCDNCGKTFDCKHKERLDREHHFCSKQCEGEYKKKNNKNLVPCVVCGKLHYVRPSAQKKIKYGSCCSMECMAVYRKTLYKGENNPNYGNRGEQNPIWKSDKKVNTYGYILVRTPDHPFANCDGFVLEHRLVAEQYLLTPENSIDINGKPYLKQGFVVHHIDGNRTNNNVDNLKVMTLQDHTSMHASLRNSKSASENPAKTVEATGGAYANTVTPQ